MKWFTLASSLVEKPALQGRIVTNTIVGQNVLLILCPYPLYRRTPRQKKTPHLTACDINQTKKRNSCTYRIRKQRVDTLRSRAPYGLSTYIFVVYSSNTPHIMVRTYCVYLRYSILLTLTVDCRHIEALRSVCISIPGKKHHSVPKCKDRLMLNMTIRNTLVYSAQQWYGDARGWRTKRPPHI